MNVLDFSFEFLKNIWESREGQKVQFLQVIILFAILKGYSRRRDILRVTKLTNSSFTRPIGKLLRFGMVRQKEKGTKDARESYYTITPKGERYLKELLTTEKGQ